MFRFIRKVIAGVLLTGVWLVILPLTLIIAGIVAIKSPENANQMMSNMMYNVEHGYTSLIGK